MVLGKQQKEYIVISGFVLLALIIGITRFQKKSQDDKVFSRTNYNKQMKEIELLRSNAPIEEQGIKYQVDSGKRVPFKNPLEDRKPISIEDVVVDLPEIVFQGIIWNSARPQVIVNGIIYEVGDIIGDGIMIKDVTKDGVHLRYKSRDFIVKPK